MKIKDMLAISWQNVVRSRSKSLLSVIAISVGVFSVSMISSLGETVGALVEERFWKRVWEALLYLLMMLP